MASAFQKFQPFVESLAEKLFNLGSDSLKIMLTLTPPVATNGVKANLTEIAAGNGYPAGGTVVVITTSAQTTGTYKLIGNDVVFTASGGPFANFQFAALYDDTATAKDLVGFWDYGAPVTLNNGETFTVDLDGVNGILQLV